MPVEQALALAGAADGADDTLQAAGVPEPSTHNLSPRKREVIRLVVGGRTNRQIAEHLVIAPRTADTHVGAILTKLDLHSRAELAVWAVEHGLTDSRPD
jgi:DNA-binding NarL/FixJ family response regulator